MGAACAGVNVCHMLSPVRAWKVFRFSLVVNTSNKRMRLCAYDIYLGRLGTNLGTFSNCAPFMNKIKNYYA